MHTDVQHICFFRLSALGDTLLAIPAIRALQRHFPDARITWITANGLLPLLRCVDGVAFLGIDKPRSIRQWYATTQRLKHLPVDVLLAAQASARSHSLYPFIKASRKIGFDKARARDFHSCFISESIAPANEHLLDGFLAFAGALGTPTAAPVSCDDWGLTLPADAITRAHQYLDAPRQTGRSLVAINPCASKEERNWPLDRFVTLSKALIADHNAHMVITGGPGTLEMAAAHHLHTALAGHSTNLCGTIPLLESAAVLNSVDTLIAPDTGPAHLATALGTPVVGLYAVARPELSGPYLHREFTVNAYPQACERFLGKSVEQCGWHERVHHADAMTLISVDQVMEKCLAALERARS